MKRVGFRGRLFVILLAFVSGLVVFNTIQLAIYSNREEIGVMRVVGASNALVRGPFVMEGVMQGGIGALVALVVLGSAFVALRGRYLVPLAAAMNVSYIQFLPAELCVLLVVGGMAVGCVGGLVAAWNR